MESSLAQKEIKVLVAIEDPSAASKLVDFLAGHGVFSRSVRNAAELKEMLWVWRPNFVIIDLMYPELNALMLLKTLRQTEKLARQKTKVFVTSQFHNNAQNVKECLRWGASDYIIMPLKHIDVLSRLVLHTQEKRELSEFDSAEAVKEHDSQYYLHLASLMLKELTKPNPLISTLHNLTKMLSICLKAVRVSVVECDPDTRAGTVRGSSDDRDINDMKLDLNKYPEILYALNTGKLLAIDNLANDPTMKQISNLTKSIQFTSMIVAPIESQSGFWGVLSARLPESRGRLTDTEIRFTNLVAEFIALTLSKSPAANGAERVA